jgi:hypothetical protein
VALVAAEVIEDHHGATCERAGARTPATFKPFSRGGTCDLVLPPLTFGDSRFEIGNVRYTDARHADAVPCQINSSSGVIEMRDVVIAILTDRHDTISILIIPAEDDFA